MVSHNSRSFRGLPSVLTTAGPSTLVRVMDFLEGPLALAAAALTFFMAYELTVAQPQPGSLVAIAGPVSNHRVAATQPQVTSATAVTGPVPSQADAKTISRVAGAAPEEH